MLIQQTILSIALLHRRHYYLASVWWTTKNYHLGLVNSERTYILWLENQTGHYKNPQIVFSPLEIVTQWWSSLPPTRYHLWYGPKTLIWGKGKLMLIFPTIQVFYKVNVQSPSISKGHPPRKGQKKEKKAFVTIAKSWKIQTLKTKFKEESGQSDFKAWCYAS